MQRGGVGEGLWGEAKKFSKDEKKKKRKKKSTLCERIAHNLVNIYKPVGRKEEGGGKYQLLRVS